MILFSLLSAVFLLLYIEQTYWSRLNLQCAEHFLTPPIAVKRCIGIVMTWFLSCDSTRARQSRHIDYLRHLEWRESNDFFPLFLSCPLLRGFKSCQLRPKHSSTAALKKTRLRANFWQGHPDVLNLRNILSLNKIYHLKIRDILACPIMSQFPARRVSPCLVDNSPTHLSPSRLIWFCNIYDQQY